MISNLTAIYKHTTPSKIALLYALLAIFSSFCSAYYQEILFDEIFIKDKTCNQVVVHPLIHNVSTIADFAVLNPMIIYFLVLSLRSISLALDYINKEIKIPIFHNLWVLVLSLVLSIKSMSFYVGGFLDGDFFDATIMPDETGEPSITVTGWIVFFWTTVFIAFLYNLIINHFMYTFFILSLTENDIKYIPLHADESGGVNILLKPSLHFLYAMFMMLVVFSLFVVYDKYIYNIEHSNRLLGFFLYIIIIVPVYFAPLIHLHKLMINKRCDYFIGIEKIISPLFLSGNFQEANSINYSDLLVYLGKVDVIDRYNKIILSFPVWPMPRQNNLIPIGSVVIAILQIIRELIKNT